MDDERTLPVQSTTPEVHGPDQLRAVGRGL